MERICSKCGKLVTGNGFFCPSCGEKLGGAVDLNKPGASDPDIMPASTNGSFNNNFGTSNTTNTAGSSNTYQGQMPNYVQPITPVNNAAQPEMTVGQWVLTLFLSSLGIIGVILLFVWAFGADTPPNKRNFARGMLIWYAIAVVLVIVLYGSLFCIGFAGGMMDDIFDSMYYASIGKLFFR